LSQMGQVKYTKYLAKVNTLYKILTKCVQKTGKRGEFLEKGFTFRAK
jgi:hypothetical protein